MEKILRFPQNFLWGCATSAYQVEGGIKNSDWSKFKDAGIACDHYHLYEKDFDLLKKLNQNAYRFSIEWSRIEPKEGKFNQREIQHYKRVVSALKKRKIVPFVVLWHFSLPLWFQNKKGWLNPESSKYFVRYSQKIVQALGRDVDFWMTINEPMVYAVNAYLKAKWPPHRRNLLEMKKALGNLIEAHKAVYQIIHSVKEKTEVGVSKNSICFLAYKNTLLNKCLAWLADYLWNDYFLKRIKNYQDFVGVNYYFYNRIRFRFKKRPSLKSFPVGFYNYDNQRLVSDIGWEIHPEGIYWVIKDVAEFKKPIYITENGLADAKDKLRKNFIRDHLYWIHRAIKEGEDVRGYFHWSLIDNLEWEKGFAPRFGLIEIDYDTLRRKPRPSAFYYAEICKENTLILDW